MNETIKRRFIEKYEQITDRFYANEVQRSHELYDKTIGRLMGLQDALNIMGYEIIVDEYDELQMVRI